MRVVLILYLLVACVEVSAQEPTFNAETLRGITGVYLQVEKSDVNAEIVGMSALLIQSEVERMLQEAGLRVLSDEEVVEEPGMPYIDFKVSTYRHSSELCDFKVNLELRQNALLERDTGIVAFAACTYQVWTEGVASHELARGNIIDAIRRNIRRFITDYQLVNSLQ